MTTQIINYHETAKVSHDLHVISHGEFDRQLDLMARSGLPVVPASGLCQAHRGSAPRLAITFDDGLGSDFLNAQKLAKRGLSATFFVSSANLGRNGYLDEAQLREMADMGMVIGSHSHEHVRLTTQTLAQVVTDVRRSKDILESVLSRPVDRFAFPGGTHSKLTVLAVRDAGFRFLFGTGWGPVTGLVDLERTVLRRNNVIRNMSDEDVMALITLKNRWRRQIMFGAKELLSRALPDVLYTSVRGLLMPR